MKQIVLLIATTFLSIQLYSKETAVPFEYFQRIIFIKVQVNNSDSLLFLFDTGANASAIDLKAADRLKLPVLSNDSVEGSGGTIAVQKVKINSVKTGNSIVNDLQFTKQDLSYSLAPPGKKIDGILGTDFLKHFKIIIDFKNHLITFSKKSRSGDNFIPLVMNNNIPSVKATINDNLQTYLRYDSGASLFATDSTYINVTEDNWISLQKTDTLLKPSTYFTGWGTGGQIKLAVAPVKSLAVSGKLIEFPFVIVQPKQGYFSRPDAIGFFGNNLFEKYEKVTIDFLSNKIFLY